MIHATSARAAPFDLEARGGILGASVTASRPPTTPAPSRLDLLTGGTEQERDPSPIRFEGAADGTKLVYEPARPEGMLDPQKNEAAK
jgi:hypothetical protein